MTFGTPWMLLLLPLVGIAGWLMVRAGRLQHVAACRLKGITTEGEKTRLGRREWVTLVAMVCTVVALARPRWNPRTVDAERRGRDLVIALDVSRSMLATDVFPSRLEMARIAVHEALPALAGQRVALVTFAGSASVRVPLTLDHEFVRYMLERADPSNMDVGGTSLQAAVERVTNSVLSDAEGGHRDLVVFTDGEDHVSDLKETARLLDGCGARVLIVGLGDPVRGARVPDALDRRKWMRHNNTEVVSRLDESTLTRVSEQGSNVTYYPARDRPFDLVALYRRLIEDAGNAVVGGRRFVAYTEGYPYLLAAAAALWLTLSPWRFRKMRHLILLVALAPGCSRQVEDNSQRVFQARFRHGSELLKFAQEQINIDALAERSLLVDAREEFLRAALLRSGHVGTARLVTRITRRLRELETVIEQQRTEEKQRHEKLGETIRRLEQLTLQQTMLTEQSRGVLRRASTPTGEAANLPESEIRSQLLVSRERQVRLARTVVTTQQSVRKGTANVLDGISLQRDTLRKLLKRAYGDVDQLPATELDPVVDVLTRTVASQDQALASLAPEAMRWPRANTALHIAAGRMQQALELLRGLQPPATEKKDDSLASRKSGDYDENMDGVETEPQDKGAQAISPGDFQKALSLRSLPIPDYTAEEILAEEAANQQNRARQKALRAGAKVEKNW